MDDLRLAPGLTARPATRDDIAPITALIAACETADDGVAEIHEEDITNLFDRLERQGGEVVVIEAGPTVAAWANRVAERAEADVHPAHQGRGIGRALLAWTEARARSAGLARVRQTVSDGDTAAGALFQACGYANGGSAWILQATIGPEPPTVQLPDGITLRSYQTSDAMPAYQLIEDAFNEWPGREPIDFERWAGFVIEHGSFAPDASRLAFDGDELVGVALGFAYEGNDEGWIEQLATKATHRHRGIARALLQSSFAGFHAAGWRACGLATDSRTGALSLYERVGMKVRPSYTWWIKDLA
ncbi:MAG: GNAT family N-acetyltransferase [Chloroflexota bacterium]|nr:MAG: GNAT family N-acetyltransferase [Chloroflexota bacterium]